MSAKRRQYAGAFKFKVALEAAQEHKTLSQIASEQGVHPNQVSTWKKQLLTEGQQLFQRPNGRAQRQQAQRETELYEQIGRLQMELAWLKKKVAP